MCAWWGVNTSCSSGPHAHRHTEAREGIWITPSKHSYQSPSLPPQPWARSFTFDKGNEMNPRRFLRKYCTFIKRGVCKRLRSKRKVDIHCKNSKMIYVITIVLFLYQEERADSCCGRNQGCNRRKSRFWNEPASSMFCAKVWFRPFEASTIWFLRVRPRRESFD